MAGQVALREEQQGCQPPPITEINHQPHQNKCSDGDFGFIMVTFWENGDDEVCDSISRRRDLGRFGRACGSLSPAEPHQLFRNHSPNPLPADDQHQPEHRKMLKETVTYQDFIESRTNNLILRELLLAWLPRISRPYTIIGLGGTCQVLFRIGGWCIS